MDLDLIYFHAVAYNMPPMYGKKKEGSTKDLRLQSMNLKLFANSKDK